MVRRNLIERSRGGPLSVYSSRSPDGSVALLHCENRSFQILTPYVGVPIPLLSTHAESFPQYERR
jgi:hypothetical protein